MKLLFKEKLTTLKTTGKVPSVLLITGLNGENCKEQLQFAAEDLDGQSVTEAKGNKLTLESDPGASIKVDDVRDLLKKMSLRNWGEGSSRYVLIPHAEMLTVQSSNALLKSLEEAPEGTYFLLAAPSKKSLLKTIVSRSFVIYVSEQMVESDVADTSVFETAFFKGDTTALAAASRADLRQDWDQFNSGLKDLFCEKVYSGEINSAEWYRLFDFMSEIDQKIGAHTDPKWLASSIERFGFSG